jgi:16S rRNA (guanine1207-N2)-methyltransferase
LTLKVTAMAKRKVERRHSSRPSSSREGERKRAAKRQPDVDEVRPYPQEALLIDAVAELSGTNVLCTSPGLAQFARAVAEVLPDAGVTCTYLDLYRANLTNDYWNNQLPNLRIECSTDLPVGEADVVALPFASGGEAELTRDFLQTGHQRLRIGGRLFASTNSRKDTWLGEQLQKLFRKLERRQSSKGVLYVGTKTEPLKKLKNYSCEFAFRDDGRLIRVFSRPGVFSHRHIDPGARHLIDEMQITSGARVLDIGCGAGTVALAAAFRAEGVQVHAVDSNVRAVECTKRGAESNGLTNVTIELNAEGNYAVAGQYDFALANPPYYSGFRIAEHFLTAGREALRVDGTMLVVTKQPEWYRENMPSWFGEVTAVERKGYYVFRGRRKRA